MSKITAYAKTLRDWEALLAAARDNPEGLANAEPQRLALEQHLALTKAMKDRQANAQAIRQRSTQELVKLLEDGRDLAMRLRGAVRANIGPKNELLTGFGVAPVRKRGSRPKKSPQEAPPETSPPKAGTQPGDEQKQ